MAPNNPLNCYGNEKTMNLNHMILTNIQASPYFKVNLYELKTYHEVIDEIYYKVDHLEPWEKGSRKTAGQTGMCGGVRGVGAGGIVSSAYCLLYKLYTLKLTHKQVMGLLNHADSPYIRGLGFMFIRYTQPPADLWDWYEDYLYDEEELDVRAGGGQTMTIGEMVRLFLTKLEWYSTLFPRIPVPIQKQIDVKFKALYSERAEALAEEDPRNNGYIPPDEGHPERESPVLERPSRPSPDIPRRDHHRSEHRDKRSRSRERRQRSKDRKERRHRSGSRDRKRRSRSKDHKHRSRSRERRQRSKERRHRSRSRDRKHRSRSQDRKHRSRSRDRKHRSRSRDRKHRSRSRERKQHDHHSRRESSFERDLKREKARVHKQRNGK